MNGLYASIRAFNSMNVVHSTAGPTLKCNESVGEGSSLLRFHFCLYSAAKDSLVNSFNQHEKGVLCTQSSCCPPPIPPLSCILCIPSEQMFTCSYSAFNRLLEGVKHINDKNLAK